MCHHSTGDFHSIYVRSAMHCRAGQVIAHGLNGRVVGKLIPSDIERGDCVPFDLVPK
jgi:hypothetical protein